MVLPTTDTVVGYPDGDLISTGVVVHLASRPDGRTAVVLDRTAFHPVDHVWPDQPADTGTITANSRARDIVDAVVGASDGGVLFVGDAPVRTGAEGWTFVVCHLVDDAEGLEPGAAVAVAVDGEVRQALSAGHTACHLASLALNEALAALWTKEVRADGRGNPDFDQLAIASSRILPFGSIDEYRLGKSLRKKGFASTELTGRRLEEVASSANRCLADWVAVGRGIPIVVERDGDGLSDRRRWRAELPDGTVAIPCGGTHLRSLGELMGVHVALELAPEGTALIMRTTAEA